MKSRLFILLLLFFTSTARAQDNPLPDLEPITADNAAQLIQLKRYGNGLLGNALVWSPDGKTLAVGGSVGLWLYNGDDLTLPPQFINTDHWVSPRAFSPDGSMLAFSSGDTLYLWNVKTQTEIAQFKDNYVAAFSPDGEMLATGAVIKYENPEGYDFYEGLIYLWDIATAAKIATLNFDYKGTAYVQELDFSPDGTWLGSVSESEQYDSCTDTQTAIQLWNVADAVQKGDVLGADTYFSDMVNLRFSPDGQRLAGMDRFPFGSGDLRFLDIKSGEPVGDPIDLFDVKDAFISQTVVFSKDWNQIAATTYVADPANQKGYNANGVGLWDAQTGELLFKAYAGWTLGDLAFKPDGSQIATLSSDTYPWEAGNLWVLNITDRTSQTIPFERFSLPFAYNSVWNSDASDILFIDPPTGDLKAFELETGEEATIHKQEDESPVLSQNGSRYVTQKDDTAQVWDVSTSTAISTLKGSFPRGVSLIFSPDASAIASWPSLESTSGSVQIWDAATGELLQTFDTLGYVVFSPDNQLLTISSTGNQTHIFDWHTGDEIAVVEGQQPQFSADGSRLMYLNRPEQEPSLFTYKEIRVWGVQAGRDLLTGPYYPPAERDDALTGMLLSQDGKILAYSSAALTRFRCDFNSIYLYNVDQQQAIGELGVKAGDYAFSPDSSLLATAVNNFILLLNAKTGETILWLEGHTNPVREVLFNTAGTMLLTTSEDGTIRLWGVPHKSE